MTRWREASEACSSRYGGELGDYSTYKVDGIINSDKAIAALDAYKELYKFTPPGWASANLRRATTRRSPRTWPR